MRGQQSWPQHQKYSSQHQYQDVSSERDQTVGVDVREKPEGQMFDHENNQVRDVPAVHVFVAH